MSKVESPIKPNAVVWGKSPIIVRANPICVDEREAAVITGLSPRTLQRLRSEGGGPPVARLGRRRVYPLDGLHAWISSNTVAA